MSTVLPAPIQAQLEAAEQLAQQNAPGAGPTPPVQTDPPQPPEPPAAPEPATPPAVSAPVPVEDAAVWKARFESLQGKYNAEVPRLHDALRDQGVALQHMQAQLLQNRQPTSQSQPTPQQPLVTANDEEKFGADLIDAMRRVAREEGTRVVQRLGAIEQAVQHVGAKAGQVDQIAQDVALTREQQFYKTLQAEVPDWQTVNIDQGWLAWLAEQDSLTGFPRQVSLDSASKRLDADRVVSIFKLYKQTLPPPQPSQREQSRAELARQVAPPRSSTTTAAAPSEATYSGQDYVYWIDPRRVHDTQTEVLQAKLAELEKAQAEGRIKWA